LNPASRLLAVALASSVAMLGAGPALAEIITLNVENRYGAPLEFRAGSGFQGRLDAAMPRVIAPGETITRRLRTAFPNSQGGGFRYGDGTGRECDFGMSRLRDPGGPWQMPVLRARASRAGIGCRAEPESIEPGGDFSIRFIVE
jgi:hypothetical protein